MIFYTENTDSEDLAMIHRYLKDMYSEGKITKKAAHDWKWMSTQIINHFGYYNCLKRAKEYYAGV